MLFKVTNVAMNPGTHPHKVKIKTINKDPEPLSKTEKGRNIIDNNTLQKLILYIIYMLR